MTIRDRLRFTATLGATSVALALLLAFSLSLPRETNKLAIIWLGIGFQLGVFLSVPRRRWPVYAAAQIAINILVMNQYGAHPIMAVGGAVNNTLQVFCSAALLSHDRDFIEGRNDSLAAWMKFAIIAVLLAPAIAGFVGSVLKAIATTAPVDGAGFLDLWRSWFVSDALGVALIAPLILRLRADRIGELRASGQLLEAAALLAAFAAAIAMIFSVGSLLSLFAMLPPLVFILFRLGFLGLVAAMGIFAVAALGSTLAGAGPFFAVAGGHPADAMMLAQIFCLATFGGCALIAALLHERQRLFDLESVTSEIYRLVAAASGDIIFVTDDSGRARYVSPAAAELLGLPETELLSLNWRKHLHPQDVVAVRAGFAAMLAMQGRADFACRLRHIDGTYRWFDARLRPSRRSSDPRGLIIGSARDITAQRLREQQLETMSITDTLTKLPNRRGFDQTWPVMWRRAEQQGEALALLIIDIDNFKKYNDAHGHREGDQCLAAVAAVIARALDRPDDYCARYGGEEFVALLRAADSEAAFHIADRVRRAVRDANIPHGGSDSGKVTVSVGVASIVPSGDDRSVLFEAADAALYRAKASGRNRTEGFAAMQLGAVAGEMRRTRGSIPRIAAAR